MGAREDKNTDIKIAIQESPDISELTDMLETAFEVLDEDDQTRFDANKNGQSLKEWFGIDNLEEYLEYCKLLEVRNVNGRLIGVALIGKQNPLTWPDGKKIEIFALAVDPKNRRLGLGSKLVKKAEEEAKGMGGKKMIINTHISLEADQRFYEKLGYSKMGVLKNYYANGDAVFYEKEL